MASLGEPAIHEVTRHFFAIAYPYVECLSTGERKRKSRASIFEDSIAGMVRPRTDRGKSDSKKKLHGEYRRCLMCKIVNKRNRGGMLQS
jgi:hypothetical protein